MGYFEFSTVWTYILVIFIALNTKWHKEKKKTLRVKRAIALGYEKDTILETFQNDLPSWVKFPEVEKIEWLNNMFKLIWQQINEYTHDLVPKILEPAIQTYVSDFKFNKVILGNVPLRIDGVKVYDQEDKRKIVMDLNVSYAGDCYITFQTFKFTGGIEKIQVLKHEAQLSKVRVYVSVSWQSKSCFDATYIKNATNWWPPSLFYD